MEELPVKIKGGSYVSKYENYGVFVFCFLLFECVFPQNHYKIGGSADFGHCFLSFFGCKK